MAEPKCVNPRGHKFVRENLIGVIPGLGANFIKGSGRFLEIGESVPPATALDRARARVQCSYCDYIKEGIANGI